jgi:hypothetical protein
MRYLQLPSAQRMEFASVLRTECVNGEEFLAWVSALEDLSTEDLRACISDSSPPVLTKILHAIEGVPHNNDGWRTATRTTRRKTRKAKHDPRRNSL